MKGRSLIAGGIVIAALIALFLYKRHERAEEIAAAGSGSGSTTSAPTTTSTGSASAEAKVRKIDASRRKELLDRIGTARNTRTAGGNAGDSTGTSGSTSKTPPPSLATLRGTISKDDIRAGVRAVIPLLAECYDVAQDRLPNKTGRIVVQMHLTGEPGVGTLIDKADIGGDEHFTADKELVECFQQTMLSVELPPIEGGGVVDVTYPIAFAPE